MQILKCLKLLILKTYFPTSYCINILTEVYKGIEIRFIPEWYLMGTRG